MRIYKKLHNPQHLVQVDTRQHSMDYAEDVDLINNEDSNSRSKEANKRSNYWLIASLLGLLTEIVAIICSFSYASKYDESDSDLARVSAILLLVGLIGQTAGLCVVGYLASAFEGCNCQDPQDPQGLNLCLKYLLIITLPFIGPFQLIAAILMMVNNTENDAANVKVFGAFIIIMDIVATVLSVVYGCGVLICIFCPGTKKDNMAI